MNIVINNKEILKVLKNHKTTLHQVTLNHNIQYYTMIMQIMIIQLLIRVKLIIITTTTTNWEKIT